MWYYLILLTPIILYIFKLWRSSDLPPGPPSLPLVGSLPWAVNGAFYKIASAWDTSHDGVGIVTYDFGFATFVVINKHELIREAFVEKGNFLSERPTLAFHTIINPHHQGIMAAPGEKWVQARRISLRFLKDFGFDGPLIENSIMEEVGFLRETINSYNETGFFPSFLFKSCTSDIMCSMLFGYKPNIHGKPQFDILHAIDIFVKDSFPLFMFFPCMVPLLKVPCLRNLFSSHKSVDSLNLVLDFLRQKIKEHKECWDEDVEPNDFIDAFLAEQRADKSDFLQEILTDENLAQILIALLLAGTDTVATGLTWACVLLAAHTDIQKKVHDEVDHVIGHHRSPNMRDMDSMPFTCAVISEILRFGALAPMSLPHTSNTDVAVGKFIIPKGAFVQANIFHVTRDPRHWANPQQFDPNHFLDPETGTYKPNENLISFSVGRRSCLGERMARIEMFLFFVSLVQTYHISLASEQKYSIESILQGDDRGIIVRAPKEVNISYLIR